jgi:hypothetical protein
MGMDRHNPGLERLFYGWRGGDLFLYHHNLAALPFSGLGRLAFAFCTGRRSMLNELNLGFLRIL